MTDLTTLNQQEILFARAYAICGDGNGDFPFDIEAELNEMGDDWMRAWDAYCAERDVLADQVAA